MTLGFHYQIVRIVSTNWTTIIKRCKLLNESYLTGTLATSVSVPNVMVVRRCAVSTMATTPDLHQLSMIFIALQSDRKLSQAWYAPHDSWFTESVRVKRISELLCIKHHCLKLDLFNPDELNVAIDFLCTTYYDVVFSPTVLFLFLLMFLLCTIVRTSC